MSPQSQSEIKLGILTVSDRASTGVYEDRSGPAIRDYFASHITSAFSVASRLVPDERPEIEAALIELIDAEGCSLVVTTGGTGPAPRDVTPEATEAICDRLLPGFGEAMRAASLAFVPTAILSRQLAGTRGTALVANLPGKPKAIADCLDAVFPAIPYCIILLGGPRMESTTGFIPKSS